VSMKIYWVKLFEILETKYYSGVLNISSW